MATVVDIPVGSIIALAWIGFVAISVTTAALHFALQFRRFTIA